MKTSWIYNTFNIQFLYTVNKAFSLILWITSKY